jgi:hypothetical protein
MRAEGWVCQNFGCLGRPGPGNYHGLCLSCRKEASSEAARAAKLDTLALEDPVRMRVLPSKNQWRALKKHEAAKKKPSNRSTGRWAAAVATAEAAVAARANEVAVAARVLS